MDNKIYLSFSQWYAIRGFHSKKKRQRKKAQKRYNLYWSEVVYEILV